MAPQLQPTNHAGFVTGSENVSPSRLVGAPSTPTISDDKDPNTPVRSSYLEELSIGALQNVQNLAQVPTSRNRHPKAKADVHVPASIAPPDSLADVLSNFHIYSPPEKEAVTSELSKVTVRQTQETVSASPHSPKLQKSARNAKHAHFALPEQPCDSVEGGSSLTGVVPADFSGLSPKPVGAPLDQGSYERAQSIPRSPGSSVARIEDTLEELDRLEDQFEAVHRMVRVKRVASPDKEAFDRRSPGHGAADTQNSTTKTGTVRSRPSGVARTSSVRKSAGAPDPATKSTEETPAATTSAATKRLSVARPLSLLPPKPPVKSSKPPTTSTFELPGEAVARRLKEQREARMSAAAAAAAVGAKPTTTKTGQFRKARSVKPPTIPTFELPGEAISRRKREEHEAKLRRQEEEEKKRREFKARPVRLSVTPSTVPRETISSRARTKRTSIIGEASMASGGLSVPGSAVPGSAPPANRRLSVISSDSAGRTNSSGQVTRGRGPALGSSPTAAGQMSRATSTSTGSISGKRSTISVEDVQYQKLRGREILQRDSILSSDRDREKREREAIARQARQEAAERSRALSREWAERQKLKAKKATTA
ncbi:hypothetical protein HMPREF1624_07179 [Sporothrix schenckii ATCC 58251]|uniref:TPX2 C-terminal domain-containing protein n=1 Tax=Sporothrix schenckii (strain ATCC 58251 / de Perez 2211183) TaxID=1391915 RepID=U7PP37_SPOS1|nr:hypothetical protein HMPREF1624_07179 [Sporothrix schenckii ATCC 58251]